MIYSGPRTPESPMDGDPQLQLDELLGEPPLFRVFLVNDDFTTMDFVVHVLQVVFHHTQEQAEEIMWSIHRKGRGLCGVYPFEVAETKVATVTEMARQEEFPLLCIMEEEQ